MWSIQDIKMLNKMRKCKNNEIKIKNELIINWNLSCTQMVSNKVYIKYTVHVHRL